MSINDDMEKALAIFKKPEIEPATPGQPGSYLEIRPQPSIAGRISLLRHFDSQEQLPHGGIAGRTIRFPQNPTPNYVPSVQNRAVPIITDQIELLRMCGSRRMPQMARYEIDANQWIYVISIPVDNLTQHMLYDGRVHDTFQFHSSSYGYETCPWCGVVGFGALHCQRCDTFFCFGLVYRKGNQDWTRCPGCGVEDVLRQQASTQTGIFPKVRAR